MLSGGGGGVGSLPEFLWRIVAEWNNLTLTYFLIKLPEYSSNTLLFRTPMSMNIKTKLTPKFTINFARNYKLFDIRICRHNIFWVFWLLWINLGCMIGIQEITLPKKARIQILCVVPCMHGYLPISWRCELLRAKFLNKGFNKCY